MRSFRTCALPLALLPPPSRRQPPWKKSTPARPALNLGSREVYVSVPDQPVRHYATFTEDLAQLAAHLIEQQITTVAMEATGVYWIVL